MIAKKIKINIGKDKKITIHVPDLPSGDAEVIILKKERPSLTPEEVLTMIPRHKSGRIYAPLTRDTLYSDAR